MMLRQAHAARPRRDIDPSRACSPDAPAAFADGAPQARQNARCIAMRCEKKTKRKKVRRVLQTRCKIRKIRAPLRACVRAAGRCAVTQNIAAAFTYGYARPRAKRRSSFECDGATPHPPSRYRCPPDDVIHERLATLRRSISRLTQPSGAKMRSAYLSPPPCCHPSLRNDARADRC